MAQEQFPIDPLQTQLVKPVTSMTAPAVAGPQQTGLSQGLQVFSKAIGAAADFAKARQFEEDKITAGLYAAKGEVAPGLISQEALLHNYNLLDENYANRVLKQVEVYDNNTATEISNNQDITSEQKAISHASFINTIKEQASKSITTNGEALGKLMVSLDGYTNKWNHDIAQFEKIQRMKTITENVITTSQNHLQQGGLLNKDFIKNQRDKITRGQLTHDKIQVGGKWYKTATNIDANKAVFATISSTVQDLYLKNPLLNKTFTQRIADYFIPLSRIEEALITSGKQDIIGDDQTFKQLINDHHKGIKAILDADEARTTEENKSFYRSFITKKLEDKKPWEAEDGYLFNQKFGEDAATYIRKAREQIDSVKNGFSSQAYLTALEMLFKGELRNKSAIDSYSSHEENNLDTASRSRLISISSEKQAAYSDNVSLLTSASEMSFGKIFSQVKNVWLRDSFSKQLLAKDRDLNDVSRASWLENWLLVKNSVKWPKEIKANLDAVYDFMTKHRSVIYKASSDRTFKYTGKEMVGGLTDKFTPEEISAFTIKGKDELIGYLEDLAQWTTDKNGEMVRKDLKTHEATMEDYKKTQKESGNK